MPSAGRFVIILLYAWHSRTSPVPQNADGDDSVRRDPGKSQPQPSQQQWPPWLAPAFGVAAATGTLMVAGGLYGLYGPHTRSREGQQQAQQQQQPPPQAPQGGDVPISHEVTAPKTTTTREAEVVTTIQGPQTVIQGGPTTSQRVRTIRPGNSISLLLPCSFLPDAHGNAPQANHHQSPATPKPSSD